MAGGRGSRSDPKPERMQMDDRGWSDVVFVTAAVLVILLVVLVVWGLLSRWLRGMEDRNG